MQTINACILVLMYVPQDSVTRMLCRPGALALQSHGEGVLGRITFAENEVVETEEALRALFEPTHALAQKKVRGSLGPHAQAFVARSPFLCISTQAADGRADVSPRGDAAGFVQILDDQTLAIPDRPGNNRLDTLSNIIANPHVGLLFLIPGFDETLRVNGQARLVTQPALLESMAVNERQPKLAIVVDIDEVFLHCAKAFRRSKLWEPEHHADRRSMPSLIQMINEDVTGKPADVIEIKTLDAALEVAYRDTLY